MIREIVSCALGALACLAVPQGEVRAAVPPPPNIIFILADDLGYGDVGCFGQKQIRTPSIDRLAAEGMRFTQNYAGNAVCAPSRCVLMTGEHPGHAFIRDNRDFSTRVIPDSPFDEGQYPIPADTITLAKLLKAQGYTTGAFGKWGLGHMESSGAPLRQGFDRFYGFNCQWAAHNSFPARLWDNDRRVALKNSEFSAHQKFPAGADPQDPASYARYAGPEYAPDLFAEEARRFVRANKDRPFFLYWPTTVPHLALQVPEDALAEYLGKFPDEPYLGDRGYLPHREPHAAYAAMITRMDREIGRMVDLVEELGLTANTLFVFTSDNGALPPRQPSLAGVDTAFFQSTGGFRGGKGSLYEGGIRVPLVVRWRGVVPAGVTSDRVTGAEDWLPTLLELVGAKDAVPPDVDGVSLAPTLRGEAQAPRLFLYREYPSGGGFQSVRIGDWKGLRTNIRPNRPDTPPELSIHLYNLSDDRAETTDRAAEHPDIVAQIAGLLRTEHRASPEFPIAALDGAESVK
jgi:arylsulfatase A-like enzyme